MLALIPGVCFLLGGVVLMEDATSTRKTYQFRHVAEAALGGMIFVLGATILLVAL